MSLPAGSRIGHYEVVASLGAGGMGEVYLADDTRLRRRVALKVLPATAADDATAAERLLREARAAARLDHVNICTIYDTGDAGGHPFIAMQYIDGQSLATLLQREIVGMKDAASIAAQAAHALAAAHKHGIIHRDVKPENIMVTRDRVVKVLDFGLAQALGPASNQETTAARLTEAGAVAGTISYMSPEQLKGGVLDERSDVFSLGAVLYEMVARSHPFGRASSAETIAAILSHEVPALADSVPPDLRRIVGKCLEKDRERRYQTARDLAVDLDALARGSSATEAGGTVVVPAVPTDRRGRRRARWLAAGAPLALLAGYTIWTLADRPAGPPSIAAFEQITSFSDSASAPAISPDGTMVTFVRDRDHFLSRSEIYVKRLPNGEAKQLTNDPRPKYGPVFTPDGNSVVYTAVDEAGWSTWRVPVIGGESSKVLPNSAGLSWIDDKRIVFSEIRGDGLHMGVVTSMSTRADSRTIYFPPHERAMAHYSAVSPDRKSVLVVEMDKTGGWDSCRLVAFDGQAPARSVGPGTGCTAAAWSPDGRWMYFAAGNGIASHLWRQRYPNGAPEPLTSGAATDEQGIAVDPQGRWLISSVGRISSGLWLHDAGGERLMPSEGSMFSPRLSSDGRRVYCLLARAGSPRPQLSVIDVDTGRTDIVLPDVPIVEFSLSADDKMVAFATEEAGERQVWLAALDRTSAPRLVTNDADSVYFGAENDLIFRALGTQANFVERITLDGSDRRRIIDRPVISVAGVSPDGRWVVLQFQPEGRSVTGTIAVAIADGASRYLCRLACRTTWSPDRRFLLISEHVVGVRTMVVPVPAGRLFPDFPKDGSPGNAVWPKTVPGVAWIESALVAPGSSPSRYVFIKRNDQRNLFRIPLK